jgi:hypothetical protein
MHEYHQQSRHDGSQYQRNAYCVPDCGADDVYSDSNFRGRPLWRSVAGFFAGNCNVRSASKIIIDNIRFAIFVATFGIGIRSMERPSLHQRNRELANNICRCFLVRPVFLFYWLRGTLPALFASTSERPMMRCQAKYSITIEGANFTITSYIISHLAVAINTPNGSLRSIFRFKI